MPISNDNQDYGASDKKNEKIEAAKPENKMDSDDLKGKQQVDGDLDQQEDKAADQKK